jgi:hypothetical protein
MQQSYPQTVPNGAKPWYIVRIMQKGSKHTPEALAAIKAGIKKNWELLTPEERKAKMAPAKKARWNTKVMRIDDSRDSPSR